jgi:hypothetical protein
MPEGKPKVPFQVQKTANHWKNRTLRAPSTTRSLGVTSSRILPGFFVWNRQKIGKMTYPITDFLSRDGTNLQ